ncbi:MAG TPA: PKD domain-containing protein [Candidatus Saccharimonadaceae bacterium]|nr:PKD domain-containing protein [Candidatus Saccharimonadaceae bacterium]
MKLTRNRLIAGLIVAAGLVVSVATGSIINAVAPGVFHGYDCSGNSIVPCGFSSPGALRSKYNSDVELQSLYSHFGWTSADINGTNGTKMVLGVVYRNGTVIVDGKTIATNAQSVGRWQDDGTGCKATQSFTIGSHKYWEATPQCRYGYAGEDAWVMINSEGQFVGAINKACGNPAPATPVIPPKPKPQTVTCDALTAEGITNAAHDTLEFNFATKATASNGATIKNYTYNFGDGTKTTAGASTSHTYAKAGTYTATVTVNAIVNGVARPISSTACVTQVSPKKNVVQPPEVSCTSLKLITESNDTYNLQATATAMPGIPFGRTAGSVTGYTYTITDTNGAAIKTITKSAGTEALQSESGDFTLSPGMYTARVVVHSNAGDKTGPQCTVQIAVPAPNQITVCRLSDYQVVTINENDFDSSKYTKDLSQCQQVQVCDTTTGQITEVYPNQIDNVRYTTDLTKCTPPAPTPTSTTPITPTELPHTGASDTILSLFGAGSLIGAISYYIASRRALL